MTTTDLKSLDKRRALFVIGASWCPDCRFIEPMIEALKNEYRNVTFYKVSFDDSEELKESLNIRRIPTLIVYKDNVEVNRMIEPRSKETIENLLKEIL